MLANILRVILGLAVVAALAIAGILATTFDWPWLPALAVGLITPLLGHAALLGSEFLVTAWLGRHATLPADAYRLDLGSRTRAWLTEVPTAIRIFCLQMPWTGHRSLSSADNSALKSAASDRGRLPVVLIHGYFCNRALFTELAMHLAARGHAVESVNLEPVFGSIDQYPPIIDQAVQKARCATGGDQVALIGHSMGGIAARAYLRDYGDEAIAQVITLGSPHRGTQLARIGHTEIVRQLSPSNPWLLALFKQEPLARYRLFTVIIAEHDNIVTPQCSQTLPGAKTLSVRGLGHVDLARHPAIFKLIDQALDEAKAQAAGTGLRNTAEITCEGPT
ncbi:MAG: esterase/lipase family protein [Burkholderiaceae bacterium]